MHSLESLLDRFPALGPLFGLLCVALPVLLLTGALSLVPEPAARAELGTAQHSTCHINGCR